MCVCVCDTQGDCKCNVSRPVRRVLLLSVCAWRWTVGGACGVARLRESDGSLSIVRPSASLSIRVQGYQFIAKPFIISLSFTFFFGGGETVHIYK